MRARWQTTPVRLCSVNRRQGRSWTVSGDGTTSVSRSQAGESSATLLECLPRRSRVTRFAPSGKPGNAQRAYGNRLRPQKVSYVITPGRLPYVIEVNGAAKRVCWRSSMGAKPPAGQAGPRRTAKGPPPARRPFETAKFSVNRV